MNIIRGLHNFHSYYAPCVLTIGNFDGVHLGHQKIVAELIEHAAQYQLPAVVMSFEPYPLEFFKPEQAPPRLTRFREKVLLLEQARVDALLTMGFTRKLAALSAQDFIEQILVKKLQVRLLLVGDDFQFGCGREGNAAMLEAAARQYGFKLIVMPGQNQQQQRISSTLIRQHLSQGDLTSAQALLGKPYSMLGKIVHGNKRGRLINFPTANIQIKRKKSALLGVYAVQMLGVAPHPVAGVANLGSRPTIDGSRVLLEVHLFDFDQDVYGRQVQVNFLHKLRDEQRFDSFEALTAQIACDAEQARKYFTSYRGLS